MDFALHRSRGANLLLACLLLAACGATASKTAGSSNLVESVITDGLTRSETETRDRVIECARLNGLDGYIELGQEQLGQDYDPAPELDGRAWVQEVGTGRVAIQKLKDEVTSAGPPPSQDDELSRIGIQILDEGPISDPDSGASRPFGCRTWAALGDSVDKSETLALAKDYSAWMQDRYEASPQFIAIEKRQFACVREAGYPSATSLDGMNLIVEGALEDWQSGRTTYEGALSIDRKVGLVYFDCYSSVESEFKALADQVAAEFIEVNPLDK